ncbi:hypothetical protein niasHS_002434 [Heterodera schachtii]|uniref:Chromo domain-containing protein n=1 Tax=Heterodera schachtii TaxID=97005 RepID=A0ABD2KJY6_HETSC
MNDSWIKKYLSSPLQSTSFSSSVQISSSFTQFDKINVQNLSFTPLSVPLPSPLQNVQHLGLTPLSRNVSIHREKNRKRPFSPLENDLGSVCSIAKIKNRASCYLVQWNCGSAEENGPSTTWEWANKLSPSCRKLAKVFEQSIAKDAKKAWEFTDYEVEAILDRTVQGELRYLVKWVGWRVPTWEKVKYLLPDYSELVERFEQLNAKDIQFWTDTKNKGEGKRPTEDLEDPSEGNDQGQFPLTISQKFPTSSSPTAEVVVKAAEVLNKLDRNKEKASYLVLWPDEAGVRSNESPNKSWDQRISLGNVEAILEFEEAVRKRKAWAENAVMYEVEKVMGRRKNSGKEAPQYLIKWKGYDEISWATMESLQIGFKHLLVAYALERPRTLEKGRREASEIRRKNVTEKTKAEIKKINERLKAKILSDFHIF